GLGPEFPMFSTEPWGGLTGQKAIDHHPSTSDQLVFRLAALGHSPATAIQGMRKDHDTREAERRHSQGKATYARRACCPRWTKGARFHGHFDRHAADHPRVDRKENAD